MTLTIDNFDGFGPRDYTAALSLDAPPTVRRRLNQPSAMQCILAADTSQFVVPIGGARIVLARSDGTKLFTGYLTAAPVFEYAGYGERGPVHRYHLAAASDEWILDRKQLPARASFINRSAGNALAQLANDLLPGAFATSAVEDVATLPIFAINPVRLWSWHAASLALSARAAYRTHDAALVFAPVGAITHAISESDPNFSPAAFTLSSPARIVNDLTISGAIEPQARVKDYFLGDGLTTRFSLSHTPFIENQSSIVDEEFLAGPLDPTRWSVTDPASAISVSSGALQIAGGAGADGATVVTFAEQIELGAALQLQHGEVIFSAASHGILGGLYSGAVAVANCFAGFDISPSGAQSVIQPRINGALAGTTLTTTAGHRYRLTTRIYATEMFREEQSYFSSSHFVGSGRGGAAISAGVRLVLEVHDIDPSNPASMQALSIVLYDNSLAAPGYCAYALANSPALHCVINFTRLLLVTETEIRSAIPGNAFRTRLVGAVADGAECAVFATSSPAISFFSQYVPVANEAIVVRYRDRGRAAARIIDATSIAALANSPDDGTRGAIRHAKFPEPRTQAECELAAQAALDDSTQPQWNGGYSLWSDFLPNGPASDVFPGDAVSINVPSRNASFTATIREVDVTVSDPANDRSMYKIAFANDAAAPLALELQLPQTPVNIPVTATTATSGSEFIADLADAEVTAVTSTTVSIDAGVAPPSGGGIEVRTSDAEWGAAGDRNLLGRFTTQTFTVTRLTRLVTYYLRQYDASSPRKYSRYSAALHVDYPA